MGDLLRGFAGFGRRKGRGRRREVEVCDDANLIEEEVGWNGMSCADVFCGILHVASSMAVCVESGIHTE